MKFTNKDVDVLIVGASSSSMVLAVQLLAYGVHPIIIDHRKGLPDVSDIVTLDSTSLDILSQIGLKEGLFKQGSECDGFTVQFESEVLKRFDLPSNQSTGNAFLNIEQGKVDRALLQYLGSQACTVYWDLKLEKFTMDDRKVGTVVRQDEQTYEIKAKWAVFSDIESPVNLQRLNLDHKKWTFNKPLYISEVQSGIEMNRDRYLVITKKGFMLAKPWGPNCYSVVSTTQSDNSRQKIASAVIASKYQQQRSLFLGRMCFECFGLAQSTINMHLRDASNLSWKLALTVLGKTDKSVLATYELERRPLAMDIFNRSYWLSQTLFYTGRMFSNLRKHLTLKILDKLLRNEDNYQGSILSLHHSLSERIVAGGKVPNLSVHDEKKGTETNLHEWIKRSGFVLLLIGSLSSHLRLNIGQWVKYKYSMYMQVYYLPYSVNNHHVFEAFDISPEQHRMVLVRPDGYIAFINDVLNSTLIDTYMNELLKWKH